MVVVLIMGVLAAIAIPTFLTTRSGANDSAGQADVTNTVTNELSYYSTNKQFMGSAGGATLDPNLPWVTSGTTAAAAAANKVLTLTSTTYTAAQTAWTNSATATGQLVMLTMVLANSGKCWEAFSDQNAGNSRTLYAVDTGGCALPGATEPAAGGTGATGSAVADKSAGLVWDPTW
jgi:type IV pilus assembly protein PilA